MQHNWILLTTVRVGEEPETQRFDATLSGALSFFEAEVLKTLNEPPWRCALLRDTGSGPSGVLPICMFDSTGLVE